MSYADEEDWENEGPEMPHSLEVVITEEDFAIISMNGGLYNELFFYFKWAIIVDRKEIDPLFDYNIDTGRVFAIYRRSKVVEADMICLPNRRIKIRYHNLKCPDKIE